MTDLHIIIEYNNIEQFNILMTNGFIFDREHFLLLLKIINNSFYAEDKWCGKTMLDILIEKNVNINMTDSVNNTVLWYYVHDRSCISYLITKGVNIESRNNNGDTIGKYMSHVDRKKTTAKNIFKNYSGIC